MVMLYSSYRKVFGIGSIEQILEFFLRLNDPISFKGLNSRDPGYKQEYIVLSQLWFNARILHQDFQETTVSLNYANTCFPKTRYN